MMRFLNTITCTFQEVADSEIQSLKNGYAIASHRWGDEEITFEDITSQSGIEAKAGYLKLKGLCSLASSLGHSLIWIDTCCINKASSTELAEAINTMYRWYAQAKLCIAYLADVGREKKPLEESEWFKRGWTLQELIAPPTLHFYDHEWRYLGDKAELITSLSAVTRIPKEVLSGTSKPQTCSVAQRMSWAAGRKTTRVEDRAYSLLGLFDIYLPMIYGEREKAFTRLQEEIVKRSTDETIFFWQLDASTTCAGLLAPSPDAFEHSGDTVDSRRSLGFGIDNMRFKITLWMAPYGMEMYLGLLAVAGQNNNLLRGILLAKHPVETHYARVKDRMGRSMIRYPSTRSSNLGTFVKQTVRVQLQPTGVPARDIFPGFWLRRLQTPGSANPNSNQVILSSQQHSSEDRLVLPDGLHGGFAGIVVTCPTGCWQTYSWAQVRQIVFWFDADFNPCCYLSGWPAFRERWDKTSRRDFESRARSQMGASLIPSGTVNIPFKRRSVAQYVCKGSPGSGFYHYFECIDLHVEIRLRPDQGPSSTVPETPSSVQSVWVVDIWQTKENDFGRNVVLERVIVRVLAVGLLLSGIISAAVILALKLS